VTCGGVAIARLTPSAAVVTPTNREMTLLGRTLRYRSIVVTTPDDVAISAQDWGEAGRGRDILFVHGFSQSHLCWLNQVTGSLATSHRLATYDLRGHGASDKPTEPVYYRDPNRWGGEVGAVIDALSLDRPLLVAWSYAGRIVLDYLALAGEGGISGLVLVGATSTLGAGFSGPAAPILGRLATAADLTENLVAVGMLLAASTVAPLSSEALSLMTAYNLAVPTYVRTAMAGRAAEYDHVLGRLTVPMLNIHGRDDHINLPTMASYVASRCVHSRTIIYDHCGHLPFWEHSDRFNADLDEFASGIKIR
jgi:non-heme chloroperoxidase